MKWFPWHPLEHRRDTYKLSLAEDGAYRRLIDEYMVNREPLPDDDAALARILGVSQEDWLAVANSIRPFFKSQDGRLVHKRCASELRAQDQRSERYSERGKKAAFAKYSKPNDLNARRMLVPATKHNITRHSYSSRPYRQSKRQISGRAKERVWRRSFKKRDGCRVAAILDFASAWRGTTTAFGRARLIVCISR